MPKKKKEKYAPVPAAAFGESLGSWSFYDGYSTDAGHVITPLLFSDEGGSVFRILGIGTTRTNTGAGVQTNAFGLVSGTDILGPNEYFGWRDGTANGSKVNNGNVSLDLSGGPGLFYRGTDPFFFFDGSINVNDALQFTNQYTESRAYSIEATTVPEPGSLLLLCAALLIGFPLLYRFKYSC